MTPAPDHVLTAGQPAHGRYAGTLARIDWSGLVPRPGWLWRRLHHKRWQYVGLGHEDVFIGVAIVDVGWVSSAFAYCFDRRTGTLLADWAQDGLPHWQARVSDEPLVGAQAWFRGPRARLSLRHGPDDALHLDVDVPGLQLRAALDLAGMAPPLLAIGPIDGGLVHATQKTTALPVRGHVQAGGRHIDLDTAWAAVDASNGLLARDTAWRWASAHAPGIGFNLQQGYFGQQENVLWLDGQPMALGAALFDFDAAQPMRPWRVRTDDGLLDLVFTPEGARAADKNFGIAASRYVQPIGTFSGTVRAHETATPRPVQHLLGVTEDHHSRW
jgi:hypothetical protein